MKPSLLTGWCLYSSDDISQCQKMVSDKHWVYIQIIMPLQQIIEGLMNESYANIAIPTIAPF